MVCAKVGEWERRGVSKATEYTEYTEYLGRKKEKRGKGESEAPDFKIAALIINAQPGWWEGWWEG